MFDDDDDDFDLGLGLDLDSWWSLEGFFSWLSDLTEFFFKRRL